MGNLENQIPQEVRISSQWIKNLHYISLILILTYQIAIMALRSWSQLRFFVSRLRTGSGNSSFATSTMPKMKSYAPAAADDVHGHHPSFKVGPAGADFVPLYVSLGLITLSMSFGMYTAVHHIKWSPNVRVKKSRRETIPEVVEPELVAEEVDHFINNSFFRKVAHLQDFDRQQVMPNPISGDVYAWKHRIRAETMKDVGVEPPKDPAPYSKAIRVDRQRP